ncbi:MAG: tannase/feruloyl esterase family alpha/beta hydrolase [Hyphomonadaceae bacterium]|nr:tannase/feruloyl esterase family alpha/beta hydrolase [Hyphomonadaceae bacterium]
MKALRRRGAAAALSLAFALSGGQMALAQSSIFADLPADSTLLQADRKAQRPCDGMAPLATGVVQTVRLVPAAGGVPEHCRVEGTLPTGIGFLVKLPVSWNGRLYMSGNGGYAGEDLDAQYYRASVDRALSRGFLTVRTDTGHRAATEPAATFAADRTKLVNHGYLAVHATVTYAKQVAEAYYGARPRYSYWDGCSTGGRQGVMSANRYPEDFDGISAAAPTLDWSSIMLKGAWNERALAGSGLTRGKWETLFAGVMRQCDGLDGLKDGLIGDPRQCRVDLGKVRTCAAGETADTCLTPLQKERIAKIYAGPPKVAGVPAWLNQWPGAENPKTLERFVLAPPGQPNLLAAFAQSWMVWIAFKDPAYDWTRFDFNRDPPQMRVENEIWNPDPDLARFKARGGKMITWWGTSDTALNPQMGLNFYDQLVSRDGLSATQDYYRFFLVPGVGHCSGGYGPDVVDPLTPLVKWVEEGAPPVRLPARSADGRYNRAYCPYPATTRYLGKGDPENPASYRCSPGPTNQKR